MKLIDHEIERRQESRIIFEVARYFDGSRKHVTVVIFLEKYAFDIKEA